MTSGYNYWVWNQTGADRNTKVAQGVETERLGGVCPKPNTVVSSGGSNINSGHEILMEKFKAPAKKIDSEFLILRKELKDMRDGRRDSHASQIYIKDDTSMCEPHEAIYVQGYHGGYHDRNSKTPYSYQNHDVFTNHVGDEELNSIYEVRTGQVTKKDNMGLPNEPNKEWKLDEKSDNGGGCLEENSIDLTSLC
nr:hypothetical protein [Tanacetum cinerariifolium]